MQEFIVFWLKVYFWIVVTIILFNLYFLFRSRRERGVFIQIAALYYSCNASLFLRTDFVSNLFFELKFIVILFVIVSIIYSFYLFFKYQYRDIDVLSATAFVLILINLTLAIYELLHTIYI